MTRPSALTVLVLTDNADLHTHLKQALKDASVVLAKDLGSLPRSPKRAFDAVLIDAKRSASVEWTDVQRSIDPGHTMVISGPAETLRQACGLLTGMRNQNGAATGADKMCLEHYVESKLAEFVKGMKNSAGRNLYPILMTAVERPLITFALKETNGNQIQAAHLLGMNRNTLRKKIGDLRIAVKRERTRKA